MLKIGMYEYSDLLRNFVLVPIPTSWLKSEQLLCCHKYEDGTEDCSFVDDKSRRWISHAFSAQVGLDFTPDRYRQLRRLFRFSVLSLRLLGLLSDFVLYL